MVDGDTVTVVLNVFRRGKYFEEQLKAVLNQSIEPSEILAWENGEDFASGEDLTKVKVARAQVNFGVWARFAYALNATSEYVCVLDDDTIPGEKWLENCLQTIKKTPGLLGTRGLVFTNPNSYTMNTEHGVYNPNEEVEEVDIVGHAWFFRREWLAYFWSEYSRKFPQITAGEDIHFSFALQKLANIPTLVPPHPANNMALWGSSPTVAQIRGTDNSAISKQPGAMLKFEKALKHYRELGFLTLNERRGHNPTIAKSLKYRMIANYPDFLHRLAKLELVKLLRRQKRPLD